MRRRHREMLAFAATLALWLAFFLGEAITGRLVLSPADVLLAAPAFQPPGTPAYEPANRLLIDPVLQFEPWLEFNRTMLRQGRLPLWNSDAGCGAPHLANGQSAVFDPFHLIAYLGQLPGALVWIAWARLFTAGLGAFVLARSWGYGRWGRWFAGLCFPLCGFLVVWLQYPVTGAAVWLPWIVWAGDRVLRRPGAGRVATLAALVGCCLLAGHIQTSAHVLLLALSWACWRLARPCWRRLRGRLPLGSQPLRRGAAWSGGMALGVALAAVALCPLTMYLSKSPVWADRKAQTAPAWRWEPPRLLDAVCLAMPYAYGSQRRGHPNVARAIGVHNINESAGGFAGLATLLWLAPAGWLLRGRDPRARWLAAVAVVGALGAYQVPPVANLLRLAPVLDVIDHRRLGLVVAFALVMLGGLGLDRLSLGRTPARWWVRTWCMGALALIAAAYLVSAAAPGFQGRALEHYRQAEVAAGTLDFQRAALRGARQVAALGVFLPRYFVQVAAELALLAALAAAWRSGRLGTNWLRPVLCLLVLCELVAFGRGMNPAVTPETYALGGPVIEHLRRHALPPARILALGEALPPNALMRSGLADVRNYDSIELTRNLDAFETLYEPGSSRTSRRAVTWAGVARATPPLREAGVTTVIASTPPPAGLLGEVAQVGSVWLGRLEPAREPSLITDHGRLVIDRPNGPAASVIVAETYDQSWKATWDGRPLEVRPSRAGFLALELPAGPGRLAVRYEPIEFAIGAAVSLAALAAVLALAALARGVPKNARKNDVRTWKRSLRRVTIGNVIAHDSRVRLSTRG